MRFGIYATFMFSFGFYDQWNNMKPHLMREKNGKKFFLYTDKVLHSYAWGISSILFGPIYYTTKLIEKIAEWEYEKI